ncbi:MAG: DUF294 nucleotidyltransferase-like domain-containing protein [Pseudomonadota bacterium]
MQIPTDPNAPGAEVAGATAADPAAELARFLAAQSPYATLPEEERRRLADAARLLGKRGGDAIYRVGDRLDGVFIVAAGRVEVRDANGAHVSTLGPGNSFGERGLLRDGIAATSAAAESETKLILLPAEDFRRVHRAHETVRRFFDRSRAQAARPHDIASTPVGELMSRTPVTGDPDRPVLEIAQMMRDRRVSCVVLIDAEERPIGIVTNRDLTGRVLAAGLPGETPARAVMTADPITLPTNALGVDVLFEMLDHNVGHLPVVEGGRLVGVVTQTDLTRLQALTSATVAREIFTAPDVETAARAVARIPEMLAQLVESGRRHEVVTRLITDIADAATKRMLYFAEQELGPAPVPYVWLACGSQGRREQSGVSDQDNCLIMSDEATEEHAPYFEALADRVTKGLAACGYILCPGDMMASNPRWRQPVRVWRAYFETWIAKPDPMARMLSSVMFDLRAISGDEALYDAVIDGVLKRASSNSIFVAHMISNAVGHAPPLGMFGGVATIRAGEHRATVDLKHNGVAPVIDLARIYALQGRIRPVNTRARLEAAVEGKIISPSGGRDLIDAYDLIAETRLRHQARQARAGAPLDNFMAPATLSDLERSHLRDAFVVVRTMQSALGHGRAAVM